MITVKATFNHYTVFENLQVVGFSFSSDIDTGLPSGSILINDPEGEFLASYENLGFGAQVKIELYNTDGVDDDSEVKPFVFPTLYVGQIHDACEQLPSAMGGIIEVELLHPWRFKRDFSKHAYPAKAPHDLIKEILKNSSRGEVFYINKNRFSELDDGEIIRYKTNESDFEFIRNKVLPFVTKDNSPVFLYTVLNLDKKRFEFQLENMRDMYEKNPVSILVPMSNDVDEDTAERIADDVSTFKVPKLQFSSLELFVNKDNNTNFVKAFDIVFSQSFAFSEGGIDLGMPLESGALSVGNLIPVDGYMFNKQSAFDAFSISNMSYLNSLNFMYNNAKGLEKVFILKASSKYSGELINVGDTVYVETLKDSWVNGKWVVFSNKLESQDGKSFSVEYFLIRPSFAGSLSTTSLSLPSAFAQVGD